MPATQAWRGSINRPDAIYVVKAGDSLSKISGVFYYNTPVATGVQRIAQANGIDPATPIQIGQKLVIPEGGTVDPPNVQTLAPGAEPATDAATVRREATAAARVQPGFTALSLSDWRVWVGGGILALAAYLMFRRSR